MSLDIILSCSTIFYILVFLTLFYLVQLSSIFLSFYHYFILFNYLLYSCLFNIILSYSTIFYILVLLTILYYLFLIYTTQRNWIFVTNLNVIILISLSSDGVDLLCFNLRLFDQTKSIV